MTRQRMTALMVVVGLVTAFAGLSGPLAWGTHGPPHTCQNQTITSVSYQATNGDDIIFASVPAVDLIAAGQGHDNVNIGTGDDYLCGNEGDDVLIGAGGADVMNGGSGIDVMDVDDGADTVWGGSGDDDLVTGGPGNDVVHGDDGHDDVEGADGDDTLTGDAQDDDMFDGRNHDIVHGNAQTNQDILYRCDTNNDVFGIELKLGPDTFYC